MQTEWQTVSALFAQAYLSENLGSLRYIHSAVSTVQRLSFIFSCLCVYVYKRASWKICVLLNV